MSRFVYQNTELFSPTATLSTGNLPFSPVGQYLLAVTVVGFGLQDICQSNSSLTLTVDPLNSLIQLGAGSTIDSGTLTFEKIPLQSACRVIWSCNRCKLNGKTLPKFTLMSTQPSWANLYGFNFSTPVFSTISGDPFPQGFVVLFVYVHVLFVCAQCVCIRIRTLILAIAIL